MTEPQTTSTTGGESTYAPHGPPPPPPPAPRAPRPPFQRSESDKVLAGVAGGLARSMEIDTVVVRIVLVVLAVTVPAVVIGYLAVAFLVPADGQPGGRAHGPVMLRDGGVGFWVVVTVLIAIMVGIVSGSGSGIPGRFGLLPLALIGVGIALWTRDGSRPASAGAAWPGADAEGPSTLTPWPGQQTPDGVVPPPVPPMGTPMPSSIPHGPPERLPRPPRSRLGPVTLALALIAAGVVAGLDAADVLYARSTEIAAVALLVIGLGLLVGAVFGRAKWLMLVALVLLPPVVIGALLRELPIVTDMDVTTDVGLADGVGERTIMVLADEQLPEDVQLLAGSIQLDLTGWEPTGAQRAALDPSTRDLTVEVGAGEVVLRMPENVAWQVWARVGLGEVQVLDSMSGETSQTSSDTLGGGLEPIASGGPDGGPVLDVVVELTLGQLTVHVPVTNTTEELS